MENPKQNPEIRNKALSPVSAPAHEPKFFYPETQTVGGASVVSEKETEPENDTIAKKTKTK